jgi:diaminopimelate epimerase
MTLPFIKMHGLGNDYVYIDCFPKSTAEVIARTDLASLARNVSDRHFGIGSDGLVLILRSKAADAKMRIFNADGSEAEMCGNAIRCVAKYLYESGLCREVHMQIETLAGIRSLALLVTKDKVDKVTVNMGKPVIQPVTMMLGNNPVGYTSVNMGNPHAVFFLESVSRMPQNTNVEFVRVRNKRELDVRVIERGSGETMACGTGACASAVAAIFNGLTERSVTVHLPGGELLIQWNLDTSSVFMTGPATEAFRGTINLEYYEHQHELSATEK